MLLKDKMTMARSNLVLLLSLLVYSVLHNGAFASNEEGLKFLEENKKKEGVIELPSGLQYKVLKKGSGVFHPGPSTPCSCHYAGTLIDGTTFDSSYDRGSPTTFAPNQVIKGWTEAMQMMVEGDKWEMYIPSELAYGEQGSPPKIPGGSVLIFQMEILEILGDDKVLAIKCDPETKDDCNEKETGYIEKLSAWDADKKEKELTRLEKMVGDSKSVKKDLIEWMQRRLNILRKLTKGASKEEL